MKKLLSVLVVVAIVAACFCMFVGCGDKNSENNDGNTNNNNDSTVTTNPNFKVGVLHINPVTSTSGYTYAHQQGILYMKEQLGLKDSQILYKDSLADTVPADVKTAIEELIGAGCNMIIGTSFGYMDPMLEAAKANPDVIFSHGTGFKSNFGEGTNNNMNNYFGRIYQARYLSGIVAGMKAKALNNPKLGYVAAFGTEIAECSSGINAFALGAQSVYPEATVSVKTLGGWYDPANETAHANALLDLGCGVIAQHCDTENPPKAAATKEAFSIGYNSDMRKAINDESCLTSVTWNWGVYYKAAVEAAMKCFDNDGEMISTDPWVTFGNYYGEYKDGLFGLAELSTEVDADTKAVLELAEAEMAKGHTEWDVFQTKASFTKGTDGKWTMNKNAGSIEISKLDANGAIIAGQYVTVDAGDITVANITGNMPYWVKGVSKL